MSHIPEPDEQEASEKQEKHPLMQALHIVTYPAAALAAYWVGKTEIRKSLYKNFVTSGAFKDLQPEHRADLAGMIEKTSAGEIMNGPKFTQQANEAYRLAVKQKFEKAGFHNVIDYWKGIHPNQRVNALLFAAGTAGLVITTSLAIVNNKGLLERLNKLEKERDEKKHDADKAAGSLL